MHFSLVVALAFVALAAASPLSPHDVNDGTVELPAASASVTSEVESSNREAQQELSRERRTPGCAKSMSCSGTGCHMIESCSGGSGGSPSMPAPPMGGGGMPPADPMEPDSPPMDNPEETQFGSRRGSVRHPKRVPYPRPYQRKQTNSRVANWLW